MNKPFQRKGAASNSQVGRDFENEAQAFFAKRGLQLVPRVSIEIGINGKKPHCFDLGKHDRKILVECKAHTWTETGNVPSAKMATWNQAMYFFHAAPDDFRKIFFALRDFSPKRNETLTQYYIKTNAHLIPKDVEIWEYDESKRAAVRLRLATDPTSDSASEEKF